MQALDLLGEALADPLTAYLVDRPPPPGRPWVLANMVAGLDGSAAVGGRAAGLSSATDRLLFRQLRSLADVVLVGAGTVRAERYGPVRLAERERARRQDEGKAPVPALAVVSRSLDLDWGAPLFTESTTRPVVVTTERADPERLARAASVADVVTAGVDRVDLAAALGALCQEGESVVLTEGGPSLLGELVDGGLLDELCLTLAPVVGGDPLPIVRSGPVPELTRFRLAHVLEEDGQLFLRYLLDLS